MKKKLITICSLTVCICALTLGCSHNDSKSTSNSTSDSEEAKENEESQYADNQFINDMTKGLQARWKLTYEDEERDDYDEIPSKVLKTKN